MAHFSRLFFLMLTLMMTRGVNGLAQTTGQITGTVTDPRGATVAGVAIVVHNVDSGLDEVPTRTNGLGEYLVPLLQPGTYDVTARQGGDFHPPLTFKGVIVRPGESIRKDFMMVIACPPGPCLVIREGGPVPTTGEIHGAVINGAGAFLLGATVTLHNTDTDMDQKPVKTDGSGLF